MSRCERCIIPKVNKDENLCLNCRDNPIVDRILMSLPRKSHFLEYVAVCPRGFANCINDPAYILHHYPDWYEELYGDKTPLEAIWVENGCMASVERDPEMKYYCYDDEDK